MAACNTFEEKTMPILLRDVEEAFEEYASNIQRDRDPKEALLELRALLNAVQGILENVGKALQSARVAMKGKAGYVVEDVALIYLNRAKSIRAALNIEEEEKDDTKNEGDAEPKPEETKKKKKKKDDPTVKELKKGEEFRPMNRAEMVTLFRDVEQSYLEQVRKLDKALTDETDPAQTAVRKTLMNMLTKTRDMAHRSRPAKPSC